MVGYLCFVLFVWFSNYLDLYSLSQTAHGLLSLLAEQAKSLTDGLAIKVESGLSNFPEVVPLRSTLITRVLSLL